MNESGSYFKSLLLRACTAAVLGAYSVASGCATMTLEGPDDPASELRSLLDELESRTDEGNHGEDARRRLARLSAKYPRDVDIHLANAVYAAQDADPAGARFHLDALFRIVSVHPEAALLRAELAMKEGNLPLALRVLDEQIRLVPDHPGLRETRGSVYYFRGEYRAAWEELQRALSLGAPGWRVAYHKGLVAEAEGRSEDARTLYENSLRLNPDFQPAASRARALSEAGE